LNVEEALERAKGAMKGAKPWQELEAEIYDGPSWSGNPFEDTDLFFVR